MATTDPLARIRRLLARADARMRDAFLAVVSEVRGLRTLVRIATLLEQGQVEEALAILERAVQGLGMAWTASFVAAAQDTAAFLSRNVAEVSVVFDQVNDRALRIMRDNQLRLVTEFSAEQRRATRVAIANGIEEGINPREMARRFRDSIGLTAKQQQAVDNYRRALQSGDRSALERALRDRRFDPTVSRAIEEGVALSPQQIDRMVDRYRQRYLAYRAEVIARTEALRSVHQGVEEMYEQSFEQGELVREQLIREWNTASDGRVRDSHQPMDGQTRPFGEPFTSGNGTRLDYPGDLNAPASETIQCRCAVGTRILDLDELPAAGYGIGGGAILETRR